MSVGTVKEKKNLDEISEAIKADVSREGSHASGNRSELSPERLAEIVKRINESFYDREDILKIVAERILNSPELQILLKSKME